MLQKLGTVRDCLMLAPQVRLSMEAVRAEAEDFNTKAYKMSKANKDDRVVTVLKDQLEEFKQVCRGLLGQCFCRISCSLCCPHAPAPVDLGGCCVVPQRAKKQPL